jgi:hypothetical protein
MDGLVRAVGNGIGGFFSNAVAAIGNAIHAVFSQIDRVVPGGALPVVVLAIVVVVLAWNVARH